MIEICNAVGLVIDQAPEGAIPADIIALAAQRDEARAGQDWARADALRDQLQSAGWLVEDTASGTIVRRP